MKNVKEKNIKKNIDKNYGIPALTTDLAKRMLQKCPDGEFRHMQYEEALLEWAFDNPIYITKKRQKSIDPHEVTSVFCTDWSIVGVTKSKMNDLLPEYLKQKEVRDIEYGRQTFENMPLPTKKEALHAFTWYVCPSAKQSLDTNIMKFDAYNKHLANTILGTKYEVAPTALFLYSGKGQTGKSYRLEAMIDTVADIGFPVKKCNGPDYFEKGFHEADEYCSGLMTVREWDNNVNIDYSLYKTLVEQETIRINRKNKSRLALDVKGCFAIASNDLPKMGAERRTSIIEFADDEFRLDDRSPEYVPTDEKKALYQSILKTYKAYIDTTGDTSGSFFKLGIAETMRDLNSKKINSATVDSFCAYLESCDTFMFKRPNFVKWICVNKYKGYKYNTRDFNAMLDDLVEGGCLVRIDNNSYHMKKSTEDIVDFLKSTALTNRYTYEEVYKKLESVMDLSFLPDDNDGNGLNTEETHSFVSYDLHKANPKGEFEVLNEFISEEPTPGHKTPRSQDNCKMNRFLYEFDDMPLDEQKILIDTQKEKLYRVVYSGNKSYHSIVSVKRPPQTREQYKWLWGYIAKHLGFLDYADPACNDNSRLTRKPGVVRKDKKKEQTLIYDDKNILDIDWVDDWCSEAAIKDLSAMSRVNMGYDDNNFTSFVSGWMKKNNVVYKPGNRHNTLCRVRGALKAASIEYTEQDLIDYGFEEEVVKETENIKD